VEITHDVPHHFSSNTYRLLGVNSVADFFQDVRPDEQKSQLYHIGIAPNSFLLLITVSLGSATKTQGNNEILHKN
jgi:hypothetical protein